LRAKKKKKTVAVLERSHDSVKTPKNQEQGWRSKSQKRLPRRGKRRPGVYGEEEC